MEGDVPESGMPAPGHLGALGRQAHGAPNLLLQEVEAR